MTTTTNDGFFAHHGFWAPGVRAFRRMQFKSKASLITLAFMVPLLWLGYLYFEARLEIVRISREERDGVTYVGEVSKAIAAASDLRRQQLLESVKQPAEVTPAQKALDQQLAKVGELDQRLGQQLRTTAALGKVLDAAKALPPPAEGPMKVYVANGRLLAALYSLVDTAADTSGLSLDPDLDTYHLMVAAIVELPRFVGLHTRMGDLAATVALAGQGGEAAAVELARLDAIAESRSEVLLQSLSKVVGVHPELKDALSFEAIAQKLADFRAQTMNEPGKGGQERAAKLLAGRQDIANGTRELRQRTRGELDGLLAKRIENIQHDMMVVGTIVGLSLLAAGYLFATFFFVMHGGLSKMRDHLSKITAGDLTDLPVPWGADEAADLMTALRETQLAVHGIVSNVRNAAEHIASASIQIAQGANDMSGRTEMAAGSLQQTSSSMQGILAEVNRTVDVTSEAARLAVDNATVAGEGGEIIGQMVTTMEAINASSKRITDILGVIDGIAFQTNILALNAAVEAARAGDQGRGFAVVAGEVRALAQRSGESAKEIKSLIAASVEKVEAGAEVVRHAGDTMGRIVTNAREIQGMLDGMARGAQTQGRNLDEVGSAVRQLDDATQHNAALSEETAAAATSLKDHAHMLAQEVARFKVHG